MNVLFLSKYDRMAASSRQRMFQYIPYLESSGIKCHVSPFFRGEYLKKKYKSGKADIAEVVSSFIRRLKVIFSARKFDMVVVEIELLPYLPSTLEHYLKSIGIPFIVDYDDAIFHQYDRHKNWFIRSLLKNKIKMVMGYASAVIAGNEYIAEYARKVNENVTVIPTVIDIEKYRTGNTKKYNDFVIGWIGSPSTSRYIKLIEATLKKFCKRYSASLVLVGSGYINLDGVPVRLKEWSEETEVDDINSFDVGIMPLEDTPWERGKCGFKLIQYMGCRRPVIASPVGVNTEIIQDGVNGFLAKDEGAWEEKLSLLVENPVLRQRLGMTGRKTVEEKYSLQVWAPVYLKIIRETAGQGKHICAV